MMDFSDEVKVATGLARQAGSVIMEVYATEFSVDYKGKNDPVTQADKRANCLIVEGLKQAFPKDMVVAEESSVPLDPVTDRTWYVDPLDGTKEFIAKNGEFSVMIGLAIKGSACMGVVYRPDKDLLYAGVVNQDAWVEVGGARHRLSLGPSPETSNLTIVTSRSHRHPLMDSIRENLGISQEMRSGSVGLKIGLIAQGKADLYIEPGPYTSVWDACGPEAILRAAGGEFTNVKGERLVYGVERLKNTKGLVASHRSLHDKIIAALESLA